MALGPTVVAEPHQSFHDNVVRPTQLVVPWVEIIEEGIMDVADQDSPIERPDTQITRVETHLFMVGRAGTKLRFRLKYEVAITTFNQAPKFEVFGRTTFVKVAGPWQRLVNLNGDSIMEIQHDQAGTGETTQKDVRDATHQYTHPHPANHTFDLDGCDEILVGVALPITVAAGDPKKVGLWCKAI